MKHKKYTEIAPEDVLLDQANLPAFDKTQLQGRIVQSVGGGVLQFISFGVMCVIGVFMYSAYKTQVVQGASFAEKAENNRFESIPIFAPRGAIYDRNNIPLAWNTGDESGSIANRFYTQEGGFGNLLGYIKFPRKDKKGFYITKDTIPVGGVEEYYNDILAGRPGSLYIETNATGDVVSETKADFPLKGKDLHLTLDSDIQKNLYASIKKASQESGYVGGVGMVVDVRDGSILSAVTYPDFDANVMTSATDTATIQGYLSNKSSVFLHRYTSGLYAPGSIVKPVFAYAALKEHIVTPEEKILSTGKLVVPNPYQKDAFTVFRDWKAHGYTNVREAIAVSSDVYFYTVGGGVPGKAGLGISKLRDYAKAFGLGETFEGTFFSSKQSVIPDPEWKARVFDGDEWRLGNTYHSSIGQYGFSITPVQVLAMTTLLANEGKSLPVFKLTKEEPTRQIPVNSNMVDGGGAIYNEIHEGMRLTVTAGTAQILNIGDLKIAGKTGTAQTGVANSHINSWFVGFWPYTNPKYAVAYLLEKAPSSATKGAAFYLRDMFESCKSYGCDLSVAKENRRTDGSTDSTETVGIDNLTSTEDVPAELYENR
ncbi:MAG: penicillin-binding transpeptidase domain-containing protein [Patescibacteria group bacterium]